MSHSYIYLFIYLKTNKREEKSFTYHFYNLIYIVIVNNRSIINPIAILLLNAQMFQKLQTKANANANTNISEINVRIELSSSLSSL